MATQKTTTAAPLPHFEWGVIFAGAAVATAVSIVLLQFGSIVGLSAHEPLRGEEGNIEAWGIIATGIWLLWVQLLASVTGGYLAGWLRSPATAFHTHQTEMRDGMHGLVVWSASTVIVFIGAALAGAFATYVSIQNGTFEGAEALTDNEKNASIIFAFAMGATSLLSAVASWWAATKGGEHRDEGIDFSHDISFKKK